MSSNYEMTRDRKTDEQSMKDIREFWEPIAVFNNIVSEQLIKAQSENLELAQVTSNLKTAWHQALTFISPRRTIYRNCKLPRQPAHLFSIGWECLDDSTHLFCRDHALVKCVICGGDLKDV